MPQSSAEVRLYVGIPRATGRSFHAMPTFRQPKRADIFATPYKGLAEQVARRFRKAKVKLTLGGEPTYVPSKPDGAEWNFTAVGPTKLAYAYRLAGTLIERFLPGGVTIYSPGKTYPGEVNPRWVVNVLFNRDGTPIDPLASASHGAATAGSEGRFKLEKSRFLALQTAIARKLRIPATGWLPARDPRPGARFSAVLPLDHSGKKWITDRWKLPNGARTLPLIDAEGPAGLRLPLNLLAPEALRRALTLEVRDDGLHVFLPPLLQPPFKELLAVIIRQLAVQKVERYLFEGYVPGDDDQAWMRVGLTADPGVLEINVPACASWLDYHRWLVMLETAGSVCDLRSWKQNAQGDPGGTGGGNHVLFGGPSLDENPFFHRPAWIASLLRYFQAHPCLSYLFTGSYVGASSQAPRPDESSRDLYDLDLAYRYLAELPAGDHRYMIGETLRHLHTDISGNTHRSEASFDKFWNVGGPANGTSGLIEFRAVESLPHAAWMSLVTLLWQAIALHTLETPVPGPLVAHGTKLHDQYFLPNPLWEDLRLVLAELRTAGLDFSEEAFREIWQWRFTLMLSAPAGDSILEVRRACEGWPLLCETPSEGGSTSRFVDTSIERLELAVDASFEKSHALYVNGRPLPLLPLGGGRVGAGLRYRRTALFPSLHPGIKPHLPLEIVVATRETPSRQEAYVLKGDERQFTPANELMYPLDPDRPCAKANLSLLTCDLRLG